MTCGFKRFWTGKTDGLEGWIDLLTFRTDLLLDVTELLNYKMESETCFQHLPRGLYPDEKMMVKLPTT